MVKTRGVFYFAFIIINLTSCRANGQLFDLERIKNDLFLTTNSSDQSTEENAVECSIAMNALKNGLRNKELWAMQMIDAWGNIPENIPSEMIGENVYEFGEFSQCLNIKRNNELFQTQYCLGDLTFDSKEILSPEQLHKAEKKQFMFQNILEKVSPHRVNLTDVPLRQSITLGVCLPASCSLDRFEHRLNQLFHEQAKDISLKLNNKLCQSKDNVPQWKTIDWITIGLLGLLLCLVILSTGYDIIFTINGHKKSELLLAFSFYTNGKKLLSIEKTKSPDVIGCLHGMRSISAIWIVLHHTLSFNTAVLPIRNKSALITLTQQYHTMIYFSAQMAVDTFLFISGLLISSSLLKHLTKTNGKMNVPRLYLHRYLRLTPLLGFLILFDISLLKFLGSGPIWPFMTKSFPKCERYWWSALLYIQNYVNRNQVCGGVAWYLSLDMQLFLISPAIVYLIYKFRVKIMPILIVLILGCVGCTVATHLKYEIRRKITMEKAIDSKVYVPTHLRFSPWLIGIITAYILFETRNRTIRIPKIFNISAWTVSLALMVVVVFFRYPLQQIDSTGTPLEYALYDALSRIVWSIALFYIVFACVNKYGGCVNWFLSHRLWLPLSRLSFSIYLLHYYVLLVIIGATKTAPVFTEWNLIGTFIKIFVITLPVSIVASLVFESPIVILEKYLFGSTKSSRQNNDTGTAEQIELEKNRA